MPFFEDHYASKLRGSLGKADAQAVLDLQGASLKKAEESLADMLQRSRFGAAKSVAVLIAPPPDGGGETLFQPVGRLLLQAKKSGWIGRLHTLPNHDGLGFYVELLGKPGTLDGHS